MKGDRRVGSLCCHRSIKNRAVSRESCPGNRPSPATSLDPASTLHPAYSSHRLGAPDRRLVGERAACLMSGASAVPSRTTGTPVPAARSAGQRRHEQYQRPQSRSHAVFLPWQIYPTLSTHLVRPSGRGGPAVSSVRSRSSARAASYRSPRRSTQLTRRARSVRRR